MKLIFITLLSLFIILQSKAQISAKITNADNQPVSLANISLFNKTDSSLVKTTLSNDAGLFKIENIAGGTYFLQVTNIGYQNWQSQSFEINTVTPTKDLGTIILMEDKKSLGEVVIRAEKPLYQQKPEGTIINVESNMLAKGSSVLEILERSPGFLVDYRNNTITLNGKSGVTVMINGKQMRMSLPQLISYLSGLSANDIEKIELLTTPPANYDADGTAGIINIVLKRTKKKGTNASVSLTGGYAQGEKTTASINLGHNTANTDLYGSYSFSHEKNPTDFAAQGFEITPVLGGEATFDFANKSRPVRNGHNATIGIDKTINTKTTIGGSINFNSGRNSTTTTNRTIYNALPDSIMTFNGTITGSNRWKNIISSVYAERKLNEGEKMSIDLDYLHYHTNSPTQVSSTFLDDYGNAVEGNSDGQFSPEQRGFSETGIHVGILKADYSKEINKKVKIEAGIKGTYTYSSSNSGIESLLNGVWISRGGTKNDIGMNESIGAGYTSVTTQVTESTKLVAGLRYEYADMHIGNGKNDSNAVDRKFKNFFPSIFLSKKIGDNSELLLSYTKRISRPTYNDLTSFIAYNDPVSVFTGNPYLKPAITHNIRFGYNYKSYSASLIVSRDNNMILQGQLIPSPGKNLVYISPQNATYQNNITLETIIPLKINSWWNMNYGFTGGWRQFRIDYLPEPYKKAYIGYSINFSQSFKFRKNFSAEISGWYNGTQFGGAGRTKGFGALNAGIKKELKNNAGTFQLTATDFLSTLSIHTYVGENVKDAFSTKAHIVYNVESARFPVIRLTYTRSFGTAIKNSRKQNNSSSDERDRIRKD